jgi:hypothetical protein
MGEDVERQPLLQGKYSERFFVTFLVHFVVQGSVERPDPKDLSTSSQCTEFPPQRGFELATSISVVRRSN